MKIVAPPVAQEGGLPALSLAGLQNRAQAFFPPELTDEQLVFFPTVPSDQLPLPFLRPSCHLE